MKLKKRFLIESNIIEKAIKGDEKAFETLIDMNIDFINILLRRYSIKVSYELKAFEEIIYRLRILMNEYNYNAKKLTIWIAENVIEYLKICSKYKVMFRWCDGSRIDCKDMRYIPLEANRLTTNEYDVLVLKNNFHLEIDEIASIVELSFEQVKKAFESGIFKLNNYYKMKGIKYEKITRSRNQETYKQYS